MFQLHSVAKLTIQSLSFGSSCRSLSSEMASERRWCCCSQSCRQTSASLICCFGDPAMGWSCWKTYRWTKFWLPHDLLVRFEMCLRHLWTSWAQYSQYLVIARAPVDSSYWKSLMENADSHCSSQWALWFSYSRVYANTGLNQRWRFMRVLTFTWKWIAAGASSHNSACYLLTHHWIYRIGTSCGRSSSCGTKRSDCFCDQCAWSKGPRCLDP